VVSVPCLDLLLELSPAERVTLVGTAPVRVAVEAAVRQGWDALIGLDGVFIGMNGFGASAPIKDLYQRFGITAEAVAEATMNKLNAR
jgi:transketolase